MSSLRQLASLLVRTPLHPQWLLGQRVVPNSLKEQNGRILDIGAADGWLRGFLRQDAQYVAVDYPVTAEGLYRTRPDVFCDASRLPFSDSTFDAVACLEVMEHLRFPEEALRELGRVLRPGGMAYLSMPFLYPIHDSPHDYQRWTQHGWQRSALAAGLEISSLVAEGGAMRTAGMMVCLALTGPIEQGGIRLILLPIALPLVLATNLMVWAASHVWPSWDAMATRYRIELVKTKHSKSKT